MSPRILLIPIAFAASAAFAAPDAPGCKDHPLVSRMAGFHLYGCETVPFQALKVRDAQGRERAVEGKYTSLTYDLDEGRPKPSRVQIIRNYENALRSLGGAVYSQFDDGAETYLRATREGQVIWLYLNAYTTERYSLQVLEEGSMAQEVVANAAAFSKDIRATGHAAVYGIHFDSGKADIRPESDAALKEVAALLAGDLQLRLLVVGHTDGVGSLEANMKLSQARADSVVRALTAKYGVAASRLRSQGAGPIAPVATNRTDEGRAKNRRVELVEQ